MSERPQGEDWWLASDGRWYPPQSQPAPPSAPQPPPAYLAPRPTGVSRGLGTSVRVFMVITAAVALLAAVAQILEVSKFDAYIETPGVATVEYDAWGDAATLSAGALGFVFLGVLVLWILLMIWGSQAHRSLSRFGPASLSWSPGWAVGAWFIPLANAVIPRLVLNEIEKVSDPENGIPPVADRWRARGLAGTGLGWWIFHVAGYVAMAVGFGISASGTEIVFQQTLITDPDSYRAGLVVLAVGLVGVAVAHALGAVYFRMMSDRLGR